MNCPHEKENSDCLEMETFDAIVQFSPDETNIYSIDRDLNLGENRDASLGELPSESEADPEKSLPYVKRIDCASCGEEMEMTKAELEKMNKIYPDNKKEVVEQIENFVSSFGIVTPEMTKLFEQKAKIKTQISKLEENKLKEIYGKLTIDDIKKIWHFADRMQRFNILDSIPEFDEHFDKLDSYGGHRAGELIDMVIDEKWNESEWLEEMETYFEPYCKKEVTE